MTDGDQTEPLSTPLRLPSYDLGYRQFLSDVADGFIAANELLGQIEMVRDRHVGPIRNVRTDDPLDQPMKLLGAMMTLGRDALLSTDIDAHTVMIATFAEELIAAQSKHFFQHLVEVCTAAGTTVENTGQGVPTIEQLRELFRKMDFEFDDNGKIRSQLIVDTSQAEKAKALMSEAGRDPEIRRIIQDKRSEWLKVRAAQSRRTLSR